MFPYSTLPKVPFLFSFKLCNTEIKLKTERVTLFCRVDRIKAVYHDPK